MTDVPPPPPSNYGGAGQPALPNPLISYWKKVVLENYTNFTGRARRAEFWWYFLANLIISIVLNIIDAGLDRPDPAGRHHRADRVLGHGRHAGRQRLRHVGEVPDLDRQSVRRIAASP